MNFDIKARALSNYELETELSSEVGRVSKQYANFQHELAMDVLVQAYIEGYISGHKGRHIVSKDDVKDHLRSLFESGEISVGKALE